MEHGDVCPLTENEGSRHQGEDRLPVIKLTVSMIPLPVGVAP